MFTVSLDLTNDGQLVAEGVTDALDDIAIQIRTMEGGELFVFTPFVRFGEQCTTHVTVHKLYA